MSMFPLTPLPPTRPSRKLPPRVIFHLAVTVATIGDLWATSGSDDSVASRPSATREGDQRTSTTAAPGATTTTAYRFAIDPAWQPKSSSRYSESAEAKAERDALGGAAATTTTAEVPAEPGSGATSTTRRGATTPTSRPRTPTSAPAVTAAPTTAAPVATAPPATEPPPTSSPETTAVPPA